MFNAVVNQGMLTSTSSKKVYIVYSRAQVVMSTFLSRHCRAPPAHDWPQTDAYVTRPYVLNIITRLMKFVLHQLRNMHRRK